MIKTKFNGYSRDGIRLYNDPGTAAAFVAGMSKASATVAPSLMAGGLGTGTMAGTMLSGTGAALGNTAALGAAHTAALGAAGGAAAPTVTAMAPHLATTARATELSTAMPEITSNLAAAGSPAGTSAANGILQNASTASSAAPATAPNAAPPPHVGGSPTPIDPFRAAPPAGNGVNPSAGNVGTPFTNANNISPDPAIRADVPPVGGPPKLFDALGEGFNKAMKYASDNPLPTSIGLYSAQKLFGKDEGDRKRNKGGQSADLSNFTPSSPSPYLYGLADGGMVPAAPMNTMGGNNYYPMAQQNVAAYTRPSVQNPISQNVLDVSDAGGLNPYTGMPSYASGGRTKDKESFYEQVMREDEKRMAEARRSMSAHTPDISGSGIFRRTLAQEQGRPDQVAASQFAQAAKRAGVKVIEMPKANMPEDFTYEAASGGIMRAADGGAMGRMPPPPPTNRMATGVLPGMAGRPSGFGAAPIAPPVVRPAPAPVARPAPVAAPVARPAPVAGPAPISQAIVDKYSKAFGPQTMAFLNSSAYQGPRMADGGIAAGLGGYSDGGRLLRGPGDGVSDSIPAVIGKRQPARLADGEFVIPARIVSELGNGSTEAGARQLYAMMERIQNRRKKSIGKGKVAVNSKANKDLPA